LAQAKVAVDEIDFIVFATLTPDVTFPGAGCFFQKEMGCRTVGALDVRAQCAGFLFGLGIADQFVRCGEYERILLAGAEVHSSALDYSDAGAALARLYGDGAGVALIGPGEETVGVRSVVLHTDGRHHREFWCEYPASRQHPVRMTAEDFRLGRHYPSMDVDAVRRFGEESLELALENVDLYLISHIFPEVAEQGAATLGLPSSQLRVCGGRHGHLSAASLPVALSEEIAAGHLGAGATVCLATAGAGFAWGAAVLRL
jgi:3-oxoacyl-[acyl-carrier-protein] synthase-3